MIKNSNQPSPASPEPGTTETDTSRGRSHTCSLAASNPREDRSQRPLLPLDGPAAMKHLERFEIIQEMSDRYSNAASDSVKAGLERKARAGGTIGRAPLGYRNTMTPSPDGGWERSIEIDPERAPIITIAFKRFADGDMIIAEMLAGVTETGLTTRGSAKRRPRPLRRAELIRLLRNPYYCGEVVFDGERLPGRHQALVDRATLQRAQALLDEQIAASKRPRCTHGREAA